MRTSSKSTSTKSPVSPCAVLLVPALVIGLLAASAGPAAAQNHPQNPTPNAAGTAADMTRRAPDTGAGAHGANPPAASVGGGIAGRGEAAKSDPASAAHGTSRSGEGTAGAAVGAR